MPRAVVLLCSAALEAMKYQKEPLYYKCSQELRTDFQQISCMEGEFL